MEDKEDKEELMNKEEFMTLPTPQGISHCSCLEHCFLFCVQGGRGRVSKVPESLERRTEVPRMVLRAREAVFLQQKNFSWCERCNHASPHGFVFTSGTAWDQTPGLVVIRVICLSLCPTRDLRSVVPLSLTVYGPLFMS